MKRIAIAGFQHETNTFAPTLAGFNEFELADAWPRMLSGADLIPGMAGINIPITGFVDAALANGGYEICPVVWCSAEPSSYVTTDAFERISAMIVDGIRDVGKIDGIYLDLHGAMVTEAHQDGEGELLRRIRDLVGPDLPVVVSIDLHANVTPAMVEHASTLNIYRTYPHLDMAETGANAFTSLEHIVNNGALFKAYRQAPFLVPLTAQHTGSQPCKDLYGAFDTLPFATLSSADIAMGFPPADIFEAGSSVVAYAGTQQDADGAADALLQSFLDAESQFDCSLMSPDDAVTLAMELATASRDEKPVVIADAQDNPGAGASSDTTGMLDALVRGNAQGAVLALLDDPEVAQKAHEDGIGAEFSTALGGKSGQVDQHPYEARFRVEMISDGVFPFTGIMYGGNVAELGPTAVLRVLDTQADVRVVVGSKRCQCLDQAIFNHIGIDPTQQRIVVVKSSVHFRADFDHIACRTLVAEAPGAHPCRLDKVIYRNLRPGIRLGPGGMPFTPKS